MRTIDGYLIKDNKAHIIYKDGTEATSFEIESFHCSECDKSTLNTDGFTRGLIVRSDRTMAGTFASFCSDECRERWWIRGAETPFMGIDTPLTRETRLCRSCQGADTLIGVGELVFEYVPERGVILRLNKNGEEVDDPIAVIQKDGECELCSNERVLCQSQKFYFADENSLGWTTRWAKERFDRDLRVSVYDLNPGQFQLWELTKDELKLRMDRVIGQMLFSTPQDLNEWWMRTDVAEYHEMREACRAWSSLARYV